jgi:hypothetical protein
MSAAVTVDTRRRTKTVAIISLSILPLSKYLSAERKIA